MEISMKSKIIKSKSYLVFKRKDVSFEVPDDFPEEEIPTFINEEEFKKWYKKQRFKNLKIDNDFDGKEGVMQLNNLSDQSDKDILEKIDNLKNYLNDLELHQKLLKEESTLPNLLLALYPEEYLFTICKKYLPFNAYDKLHEKLMQKFPKEGFQAIIDKILYPHHIDSMSESFIDFLLVKKIRLKKINFIDLKFTEIGTFNDLDSWNGYFDDPPFTVGKVEKLIKICNIKVTIKDQQNKLREKVIRLITSNQKQKLVLLIKKKIISTKLIQSLLKENGEVISSNYKKLLVNSLKDDL
jgi:hypothetical protein